MTGSPSAALQTAIEAAKLAGKQLLEFWHTRQVGVVASRDKGSGNIVTGADLAADRVIRSVLAERSPNTRIFSEESGITGSGSDERLWVVEPLDGTNNFAIGIAQWSVSIGLLEEGRPRLGVIHNPVLGQTTFGERGFGTYVEGSPTPLRGRAAQARHVVALDSSYGSEQSVHLAQGLLLGHAKRVLTNWSPALDFVALASGAIDAIVCLGSELEDKVAGFALIEEAGCGIVTLTVPTRPLQLSPSDVANRTVPAFVASADERLRTHLVELLRPVVALDPDEELV